MDGPRVARVLKRDVLGRIELLEGGDSRWVRRVACGGRIPGSAVVARQLLAREARALERLRGLSGVPQLVADSALGAVLDADGHRPPPRTVLVRSWLEGIALHQTEELPEDFFERLLELVGAVHRRGVCHNDLHKEQNVLVGADGYPCLIDFQLASTHGSATRIFRSRVHDDVRHVEKHRRRYAKALRSSRGFPGSVRELRRTPLAALWRRFAKPVYVLATRRILHVRDGELRRSSLGPWPSWTPPLGPRSEGRRR